jgi:GH18 family chitinase
VWLKNLPVSSLTHLHIAFGYIAPNTFDISMMDGVPDSVIDKITQLKDTNPAINMVISLGGWSFSDQRQRHDHPARVRRHGQQQSQPRHVYHEPVRLS